MEELDCLESMLTFESVPETYSEIILAGQMLEDALIARSQLLTNYEMPRMISDLRNRYPSSASTSMAAAIQNKGFAEEVINHYKQDQSLLSKEGALSIAKKHQLEDVDALNTMYGLVVLRNYAFIQSLQSINSIAINSLTYAKHSKGLTLIFDIEQNNVPISLTGYLRMPTDENAFNACDIELSTEDFDITLINREDNSDKLSKFEGGMLEVLKPLLREIKGTCSLVRVIQHARDFLQTYACARALLLNPAHKDKAQMNDYLANINMIGTDAFELMPHEILKDVSVKSLPNEEFIKNAFQFYSEKSDFGRDECFSEIKSYLLRGIIRGRMPLNQTGSAVDIGYLKLISDLANELEPSSVSYKKVFNKTIRSILAEYQQDIDDYAMCLNVSEAIDHAVETQSLFEPCVTANAENDFIYTL